MHCGVLSSGRPDIKILKHGLSLQSDVKDACARGIEKHFREEQRHLVGAIRDRNLIGNARSITFRLIKRVVCSARDSPGAIGLRFPVYEVFVC